MIKFNPNPTLVLYNFRMWNKRCRPSQKKSEYKLALRSFGGFRAWNQSQYYTTSKQSIYNQ